MSGKYQAYPKYKDSSDDWLGEIPSLWVAARFKYGINLIESGKRESVEYSGILSIGGEHVGFNGKLKLDNLKYVSKEYYEKSIKGRVNKGDILIVKDGATIGKTAYVNEKPQQKMLLNEHVYRVVSHKFNYYYILSSYFQAKIWSGNNSSAQEGLNLSTILNIPLIIPSRNTQEKIANFLDHETAKIDTLIEKQQQLIKLLKEKRQAVISHAVTKGLNPNAPMRDSGVEWLGKVPVGWDVKKFTRCATIRNGQVDPTKEPYSDFTLIAPNHIESGTGRLIAQETAADQGADSGKYLCKEGEVIYSKIRPALAKVCISPSDNTICSADMYPIQGVSELSNEFLFWSLLSTWFTSLVILESDRVAMPKINREKLAEIMLPVPPRAEQVEINAEIRNKTEVMDLLMLKAEKAIALANERRTALISAAVTGKIDVRNWTAPEPLNTANNNKEVAA